LFSLLFNILCMVFKNLNIFINHLESQNTSASTTLKCFFSVHLHDGMKVLWKLQASSYHCLGYLFISPWISQGTFNYITYIIVAIPILPDQLDVIIQAMSRIFSGTILIVIMIFFLCLSIIINFWDTKNALIFFNNISGRKVNK